MPEINILPKEVYQLIAAGEVVERPASVVKEMIENSVDAGATAITVEIRNGGTTYIRITDNGCGIAPDQVKKVFMPHATSKIKTESDLDSIGTLGFRGEAMSSIAAVAHVELLTRTPDADMGTRYEIAGGEETESAPAGCPVGTTVVVRDIFFNTPARMKFLKKDVTEGNAVAGIVDRMAVSHPEISFCFIRDGKQVLLTSGNGDLKSAVYAVFGKDFAATLMEVDYSVNHMRVTGVVTKPQGARKSRAMEFFFINHRLVKCQTATAALEQAFKNSIMVGRFPGCVLNIECDTAFVDVNVHPAKIEVRFANERPVFELVYYGVKNALETQDTVIEAQLSQSRSQTYLNDSGHVDIGSRQTPVAEQLELRQKKTEDFWQVASAQPSAPPAAKPSQKENRAFTQELEQAKKISTTLDFASDSAPVTHTPASQPGEPAQAQEAPPAEVPDFTYIGEAFKTYLIIEMEGAIYFIDKHAAHERMNFEKLKAGAVIHSQVLLTPVAVKLARDEYNAVLSNLPLYEKCGFAVEDFGNSTVLVRECPSILDGENVEDLMVETAGKLLSGKTDITPEQMDWIFHSTACRAAVKGGDINNPQELRLFVEKLLSMPDIRYCPHGRPVMIKMSRYDIEKQFGRQG